LFRRYDGRAALPDLRQYEATPDMDLGMTEVERQIEGKCDVERYWALHHKEDQVELFRGTIVAQNIACQNLLSVVFAEEELKRLQRELNQKEFGAVQYNYDENSQQSSANSDTNKEEEEDDTPFVAPTELDIPVNMVLVCQNCDETI
jgi:hypothetical protein